MPARRLRGKDLPSAPGAGARGLASTGPPRPRSGGLGGGRVPSQERPAVLGRSEAHEVRYLGPTSGSKGRTSAAQRIKATVLISQVLVYYGARADFAGRWQSIRCPFHDDRHASASYNDVLGQFFCHGCGVHGDIFDLVQSEEGLTFLESVSFIEQVIE